MNSIFVLIVILEYGKQMQFQEFTSYSACQTAINLIVSEVKRVNGINHIDSLSCTPK